jgi:hypothetical protein
MLLAYAGVAAFVLSPSPCLLERSVTAPRMLVSTMLLDKPMDARDELKPRFSRGEDSGPKTSFSPSSSAGPSSVAEQQPERSSVNQQLLAEIRALQPEPVAPAPERKAVDLNGILPQNLLIGAVSYGVFAALAWQFTGATAEYFAEHPMDSAFYVVARLSGVARVVVVGMGALGTGVASIAAAGQLALAVQVALGIAKGAPRVPVSIVQGKTLSSHSHPTFQHQPRLFACARGAQVIWIQPRSASTRTGAARQASWRRCLG